MQFPQGPKPTWRGIRSVEAAQDLIDVGILLNWSDMRTLKRTFSENDQIRIVQHFSIRLAERLEDRLSSEIIVESLLIWMAANNSEPLIDGFLESVFEEPERLAIIRVFTEIALTSEATDYKHFEKMFAVAVSIISQFGLNLKFLAEKYPEELAGYEEVLTHIGTYLISVANNNNSSIRLCLMNYFGVVGVAEKNVEPFNRIMSRFGHTVLDSLFALLFMKKTEGVALQFLMDNLPFVLLANDKTQQVLFEIFKFYMLKKPDKFALFLTMFVQELKSDRPSFFDDYKDQVKETFIKHLALLLKIVSEVDHKVLAREILFGIVAFDNLTFRDVLIADILRSKDIRGFYKDSLVKLRDAPSKQKTLDSISQFRSTKRGRKPSFSRTDGLGILQQVNFLGTHDAARVS